MERVQIVAGDRSSIYLKPKAISYRTAFAMQLYTTSGSSIHDYSREMNSRTKLDVDYVYVSGSVDLDIGSKNAEKSQYEFSKVQFNVSIYVLHMPHAAAAAAKYLDPAARAAIDSAGDVDPSTDQGAAAAFALFDLYGTHLVYLSSLVMGGRAAYDQGGRAVHGGRGVV